MIYLSFCNKCGRVSSEFFSPRFTEEEIEKHFQDNHDSHGSCRYLVAVRHYEQTGDRRMDPEKPKAPVEAGRKHGDAEDFLGLTEEERVSLETREPIVLGSRRGALEKRLVAALRDSIRAHGPITEETASSAAKRIVAAIKVWNREFS